MVTIVEVAVIELLTVFYIEEKVAFQLCRERRTLLSPRRKPAVLTRMRDYSCRPDLPLYSVSLY